MNVFYQWFLGNGIYYLLYTCYAIIVLLLLKWMIELPVSEKARQWRYRLQKRKGNQYGKEQKKINSHPIAQHIVLLIKTTSTGRDKMDVTSFLVLSGFLFIVPFSSILLMYHDLFFALFAGSLLGLIPYMILHIRLRKLRFVVGESFLNLIQDLHQQYSANQHNILYALQETQKYIREKALKQVIMNLLYDLQTARNEKELREAIQIFVYAAGTNWANRLGNIILKAYLNNEDVLRGLLNLSKQMEDTEEMLEEEKSHALDAVLNGYLTLPVWVGGLLLGYYMSGPQSWWELQFGHEWSLTAFILSSIGVIFSIMISMILKRPKNDL
ncbi:hypothetical protein [Gracilibacillus sp. YIM 98692]|uniref:hypothetical protein n=1 Tax=Gracilibacillus sp. YIM 98692 TaxID=2663532 RepID=UPI0013D13C10|nr:hypothetical protein [Gracilibacillus sp. YIM 98692]